MDNDVIYLEETSGFVFPSLDLVVHLSCNVAHDARGEGLQRSAIVHAAVNALEAMGCRFRRMEDEFPSTANWKATALYASAIQSIASADLLLVVHTYPSRGIGVECQVASNSAVPVHIYYHSESFNKRAPILDAIAADPQFPNITFDSANDLERKLAASLTTAVKECLIALRRIRTSARSCVRYRLFQKTLQCAMLLNNWTFEAAEKSGMSTQYLRDEPDRLYSMTLITVVMMNEALGCKFVARAPTAVHSRAVFPTLEYQPNSTNRGLVSAAADFVNSGSRPFLNDECLFSEQTIRSWRKHLSRAQVTLPSRHVSRATGQLTDLVATASWPLSDDRSPSEKDKFLAFAAIKRGLAALSIKKTLLPNYRKQRRPAAAQELYRNQLLRAYQADFAVVVFDPAATGVGASFQQFLDAGLPCFTVTLDDEWPSSKLIDGMPFHVVDSIVYRDDENWLNDFTTMVQRGLGRLRNAIDLRRSARAALQGYRFDQEIRKYSILRGMEFDQAWQELSSGDLVRYGFWSCLKESPELFALMSVMHIACFAQQNNWRVEPIDNGGLVLRAPVRSLLFDLRVPFRHRKAAEHSLENLVAVAANALPTRTDFLSPSHSAVLNRAWSVYAGSLASAPRDSGVQNIVGQETWRQRLHDLYLSKEMTSGN